MYVKIHISKEIYQISKTGVPSEFHECFAFSNTKVV